MIYYPVFLNLKGKKVLLFGAGAVALRKAKSLVASEAKLSVISREFSEAFRRFAKSKKIKLQKGSRIPKSLSSVSLVVAATSDARFNRALYQACSRKGILVNVVDDPKHSNFIVPSVVRRGNLQIAISTGGASPYLAKLLRQKFEGELDSRYADLARFLKKERVRVKNTISSAAGRRNYFEQLVNAKLKQLRRK